MRTRLETPFGTMFQPWPIRPLSEVAFFQEGPGLRKWQWTEAGMKVINVTNILGDGSVDVNNTARFIASEEFQRKYTHFAVEAGDIVVASSGNTYGKVGRITHAHLPLMMNTSVIRFRSSNPCTLDQGYLYAFLRSPLFRNQVESYVIGSAQPNFGPSHLKRMVIPCPEVTVQRKIASILSAYDDLIENNTRRIAILEEMAQSLYRQWFVEFRFPGHEKARFIDSPLGQIPKGWECEEIGKVIDTLGGGTPSTKEPRFWDGGEITWYSPTDLTKAGAMFISGSAKRITPDGLAGSSAKPFPAYSVMMTSRATIGVVSITTTEACTNQGFITCVPNERLTSVWLYFWLHEKQEMIAGMASGATFKEISRGTFRKLLVAVPSPAVSRAFADATAPCCKLLEVLLKKQVALRTTRDLLLPKLMSGQVDVEELDIDIGESLAEADA